MARAGGGTATVVVSMPDGRKRTIFFKKGEAITAVLPLPEDEKTWGQLELMFATRAGNVRRNSLADFENINRNGKIAMKLDEGEAIVDVQICTERDDVLLTTANGQCIRFPVDEVRVFKGRGSMGVRGITLVDDDQVVGMEILSPGATILSVTQNGYGKRTPLEDYRLQKRGGQGIITIRTSERNGPVIGVAQVTDEDEVMLITDGGKVLRCRVSGISTMGRATQGVTLMDLAEGEKLVAIARLAERDAGGE